jgi:MFS family permease
MPNQEKSTLHYLFSLPVVVAALGYFVDIYDLLLFGIVRKPSLESMGLMPEQIDSVGTSIFNWQMGGLLIGGILWGILGDKKGRLSVLFGSIITYSLANIACGFIPSIEFMDKFMAYRILRFVAGIGLAGELGAGITLVSEILPTRVRAIATSFVAGVGLLGAVVANFTVKLSGDWTIAYFIGGTLGIMLLLLRVGVFESGMFKDLKGKSVEKGDFFSFFTNKSRFYRYMKCIGIGLPTWFVIGILATFADQFAGAFGITEKVSNGDAIMWCYVGLSVGDLLSGFISHWLHSRRKAVALMMFFTMIGCILYLYSGIKTAFGLYAMCLWVGFGIGYWAMFVTIAAEQFGTNLRATAATTVPNMVRGATVLMTTFYAAFKTGIFTVPFSSIKFPFFTQTSVIASATIVGVVCFALGFYSILSSTETHGRDMDFLEE